jgi:hypothetical protein
MSVEPESDYDVRAVPALLRTHGFHRIAADWELMQETLALYADLRDEGDEGEEIYRWMEDRFLLDVVADFHRRLVRSRDA